MTCYALLFLIGGAGYGMIELLWRGHTHPTMIALGGLCLAAIFFIDKHISRPLLVKALIASAFITLSELVVGIAVNRLLDMRVWDYSDIPLNLWGQICPLYCLYWFFLSIGAIFLCRLIDRSVFSKYPLIFG